MTSIRKDFEASGWESVYENLKLTSILVKVSNRCNLNCTYCYWFRDKSSLDKPKVLSLETEDYLIVSLRNYFNINRPINFHLSFHGGEPLLLGKNRFKNLLNKLNSLSEQFDVDIFKSLQTNGVLIDAEWCEIFKENQISIGVSLDGPEKIHNKNRIDFKGKGSYSSTIEGLKLLKAHRVNYGVLSVYNNSMEANEILNFFFDQLNLDAIDILIPDITHADKTENISRFYIKLFQIWIENYAEKGYRIRFFENSISALLGFGSKLETIGYSATNSITLDTDGEFLSLDTLKICEGFNPSLNMNIKTSSLQAVLENKSYLELIKSSLTLHPECVRCEFNLSCGGGYLPHRWNPTNKTFQNPSIYCRELKSILHEIKNFISKDTMELV